MDNYWSGDVNEEEGFLAVVTMFIYTAIALTLLAIFASLAVVFFHGWLAGFFALGVGIVLSGIAATLVTTIYAVYGATNDP